MAPPLLITLSYLLFIITDTNGIINKKFVNNIASKSLLCNSCGIIAETLNGTLFEDSNAFETNVGFRLDSNGKKIRKNSEWLKIHITLEDITCEWKKDLFSIGKRKSGLLYLIINEDIKRNEKLNKLNKQKALEKKEKYYLERKVKIIKKESKYFKMMNDMCILMTELFDDWLTKKQSQFKNVEKNELRKLLNISQFCLKDLKYKNKQICNDDMLKFKLDFYSNKKILIKNNTNIDSIPKSMRWFIADLLFCYFIILAILALYTICDVPIIVCKLSIIILLFCPNYIYQRNKSFANLSTLCLIWYWYVVKLVEIFNNEHFFKHKSFLFCWLHCAAMKNMFKSSIVHASINIEAFIMMLFNIMFLIQIHPYIFIQLFDKIIINDICLTPMFPNIFIQIFEILSYIVSILYCMDYGGIFLLNLLGYHTSYDMISPWKSYSLKEFWSKRWNQSVAFLLKTYVYKPIIKNINNRNSSLIIVFLILGITHVSALWLDGFEYNMLISIFVWFLLQPFCLLIEEKTIISFSFGSSTINEIIHSLFTFTLLFASFFVSLTATCYVMKNNQTN